MIIVNDKMDLGEEENFEFKHPYFFENFSFKFEGFEPKIKESLENVVKSMGATVSEESKHVFTDIRHTSVDQNKNYYFVSYLSNSILAEKPLDIENYKIANLVQNTDESRFCCMNAKYIWKNKSCTSYYNKYICCELCMKLRQHETSSFNLDENPAPSISSTNGVSQDDGANNNNSDSSDPEIIKIHSNVNFEKPSCSTYVYEELKANKRPGIDRWKRANNSDISSKSADKSPTKKSKTLTKNKQCGIVRSKRVRTLSSSSNSDKSIEDADIKRKGKNKRQRLSSSSEIVSDKSDSDFEFISDTAKLSITSSSSSNEEQDWRPSERRNENKNEWWWNLPAPHIKRREVFVKGQKQPYTYDDKRLMIAYLIKNKKIENGTSRKPWVALLKDGYLQNRTSESLNNHYRKVLLPTIESFKLPKDIEKKFINDRKRHHIPTRK